MQYLVVPVTTKETLILKKYNLSIKTVVRPLDNENFEVTDEAYSGDGVVNSEFLNGLKAPGQSVIETIKLLEERKIGKEKVNFRLKDWGVSRQRYWGCLYQLLMMKMAILNRFRKINCRLNFQKY